MNSKQINADQLLTATQAAGYADISLRRFLKLCEQERGPVAYFIGQRKFYDRAIVIAWNKSRKKTRASQNKSLPTKRS